MLNIFFQGRAAAAENDRQPIPGRDLLFDVGDDADDNDLTHHDPTGLQDDRTRPDDNDLPPPYTIGSPDSDALHKAWADEAGVGSSLR